MTKLYPGVVALDSVDLDLYAGHVVALMGENGAGKSTLLGMLDGSHQPDGGEVLLGGRPIRIESPKDARQIGVRVVHQEPVIVPQLSVAENLFLGELPRKYWANVDRRRLVLKGEEAIEDAGFAGLLPSDRPAGMLSAAQRQLLEIVRALKPGLRVLALDEPTSSLTDDEVRSLFELIRRLRAQRDVALVYVSHRFGEIFRIADWIEVLRDGRQIATKAVGRTTREEIIGLMVGRELVESSERTSGSAGETPMLVVDTVSTRWHQEVSLTVHAGEIVGLAGLMGAGRSELARVLLGDLPRSSGTVSVDGDVLTPSRISDAIAKGLGLAPEDRKQTGLILSRPIRENIGLGVAKALSWFGFVRGRAEKSLAIDLVDSLGIRARGVDEEVGRLSGGNQQKVVLARWLALRPKCLILDEPTRGIDVGSKEEIYRLVQDMAGEGMALLVISSELPELLRIADRIVVMHEGRLTGELTRNEATEEKIMALAIGGPASADMPGESS